ncbi:hypothetical protein [Planomonospora sp. ID82291]|uniref:hypothetical protein n=1 Tax=Planomonospora sp. ID82291 TaxID=2738136 RepID=UPI0018C396EC|nr:hypothetical protein [Planomonospora sp. ID82291]MBG0816377.1 hypothetical protein [Planomonospora sp. ID82291]
MGPWGLIQGVRLVGHAPVPLVRALVGFNGKGVRLHDEVAPKDYPHGAARPSSRERLPRET